MIICLYGLCSVCVYFHLSLQMLRFVCMWYCVCVCLQRPSSLLNTLWFSTYDGYVGIIHNSKKSPLRIGIHYKSCVHQGNQFFSSFIWYKVTFPLVLFTFPLALCHKYNARSSEHHSLYINYLLNKNVWLDQFVNVCYHLRNRNYVFRYFFIVINHCLTC